MKKTFRTRVGPGFIAGGLGRDGPFVLVYRKVDGTTGFKISYGTRGPEVQVDKKILKNTKASLGFSFANGPYAQMKYKERGLRISANDGGRPRNRCRNTLTGRLLRGY